MKYMQNLVSSRVLESAQIRAHRTTNTIMRQGVLTRRPLNLLG